MAGKGLVAQGVGGFAGAGLQQWQVRLGKAEPEGDEAQRGLFGQSHCVKLTFFEWQQCRRTQADRAQTKNFVRIQLQTTDGELALPIVVPQSLRLVHAEHKVAAAQRAKGRIAVLGHTLGVFVAAQRRLGLRPIGDQPGRLLIVVRPVALGCVGGAGAAGKWGWLPLGNQRPKADGALLVVAQSCKQLCTIDPRIARDSGSLGHRPSLFVTCQLIMGTTLALASRACASPRRPWLFHSAARLCAARASKAAMPNSWATDIASKNQC